MHTALNVCRSFARSSGRAVVVACASLTLIAGSVEAQAQGHGSRGGHGYHGGHGHHGAGHHATRHARHWRGGSGWVWGGVGLGLGLGLASHYASPWNYGYPEQRYVVVNPPTVVYEAAPPIFSQPVPARGSQSVIYPRDGQSPARTDADADACSEWAGQQPNATSDRSVFFRATQACMDARGYTVR